MTSEFLFIRLHSDLKQVLAIVAVAAALPPYHGEVISYHGSPPALFQTPIVQVVQPAQLQRHFTLSVGPSVHPIPMIQQPIVKYRANLLHTKYRTVLHSSCILPNVTQHLRINRQEISLYCKMFKLTLFFAFLAVAHAGIIAPVVPAHPVVAHHVVAPVHAVSHSAVVHPAPIVHAPVVHAAPIVPVVRHSPLIAVHHG
ncbi:hypothetical protein B5X24_HaOG205742 [Helicoverpa armigera]|uniref:Uncharacterized protein n=2 Tax=Helicoverpa armigera TaxID=29058 RepID=A0A2W1BSH7_HELAM|nr:hypothetical protein B5X24_HaOG205742 [Helicoverpa armigera]